MTEPESIRKAREAVRRYDEQGICPNLVASVHAHPSVTTCPECSCTIQPTLSSVSTGSQRIPRLCAFKRAGTQQSERDDERNLRRFEILTRASGSWDNWDDEEVKRELERIVD